MLVYAKDYKDSKKQLENVILGIKKQGYHVFWHKELILKGVFIDRITIKSKNATKNRIILSAGLHGIEGFVGHSTIIGFLDVFLDKVSSNTEVVIYHVLNPYGMIAYSRTNENNVDLNRNFSTNGFKSRNDGYNLVRKFFLPKQIKNKITMNAKYYTSLTNMIRKYGIKTLNEAILLGQNIVKYGLYYSGRKFQPSTKYIIEEVPKNLVGVKTCLWIDIHTGYGPRYQMSIVNSKYEKDVTSHMKENMNYPLILGVDTEDFYDVNGDMLEYIYSVKETKKSKTDLLALCYEFGTLGEKTRHNIESLKAIVFENHARFENPNPKIKSYVKELMKEQFMPSAEDWRVKAYNDFMQATEEVLKYKNII